MSSDGGSEGRESDIWTEYGGEVSVGDGDAGDDEHDCDDGDVSAILHFTES